DRTGGNGGSPLHAAGGQGHRPAQQVEGVRIAGKRSGYRRGQSEIGFPSGSPGLRHRSANSEGSGGPKNAPADQQPPKNRRIEGARPGDRRGAADTDASQRG